MKVVTFITSSHRNGTTKKIVDSLTIGIEDAGGSNEVLFMDDYKIKYCTGCQTCKNGGGCILDDDYNLIMDKVRDADYFIFTAPIFYNDIAGHSKMFLDRLGSLSYDPNLEMNGKKAMLIITHFSEKINDFVVKNVHRTIVTANFRVNKILDVGGLLAHELSEFDLEDYEDIGYELEDYEVIPHELDLDSATI